MLRPTRYEIEICGRTDARVLRPVIDDFRIVITAQGTTRIVGDIQDTAHLHGLLAHFTSKNVELVALRRLDEPGPPTDHEYATDHQQPTNSTTGDDT